MTEEQILILNKSSELNLQSGVLLESICIPHIIKNKALLTPGNWNGYDFSKEAIATGFKLTDWNDKKNYELIKDHADKPLSVDAFLGYVKNAHLSLIGEKDGDGLDIMEGSLVGDLEIWDKDMIIKLAMAKAKFGVSAKVKGYEDGTNFMIQSFNNFSVVDNPACKNAYINLGEGEKIKKLEEEAEETEEEDEIIVEDEKDEELACKKKKMEDDEDKDEDKKEHPEDCTCPECTKKKEDTINKLKGGLKQESKMESKNNDNVELTKTEAKVEAVIEQPVVVQAIDATAELKAKVSELSEMVKVLTERLNTFEKLSQKEAKLSENKIKAIEGHAFKVASPMTIAQLAEVKDNRHSKGILAMAQKLTALQITK
jgi:hypothetical protein